MNTKGKKQTIETVFEMAQMFDIAYKNFETAVIKMFKKLKKIMSKELNESMMTMTYQIENINKEMKIIF